MKMMICVTYWYEDDLIVGRNNKKNLIYILINIVTTAFTYEIVMY